MSHTYVITNQEIIDEINRVMADIKKKNKTHNPKRECEEFTFPCSLVQMSEIEMLMPEFEFEFEPLNKWVTQGYVILRKTPPSNP